MATILPFLRAHAHAELFDDEATRIMGEAFDAACTKLGDINELARETVAGQIIAAAKKGERDPIRLRDAGIEAVAPHAS